MYNSVLYQFEVKVEMKKNENTARRAVNLEYRDAPGKNVAAAGTFSDWQPKAMKDKNGDGVYRCRLLLSPGEYQYKFLVDGEWRSDAMNADFVPNEYGSLNSVLIVEERKSVK
jgi:1,4-alpha-glucan branching enzyme